MADEVPGRVEPVFCQPCSREDISNVADVYCEDCGEYQCKECEKIHKRFPVMSKHKLVNANEISYVLPKYDMKGLDQCTEHKEKLQFLCEDDEQLCCSTCAIVKHRRCHSVVEIEKKACEEKSELKRLNESLLEIETNVNNITQHVKTVKINFITDITKVTENIQERQNKFNEMFENLKRKVSEEIESFKHQAFNDFDMKENACRTYADDKTRYLSQIQGVSEFGTRAQQLIIAHHLKDQVDDLNRKTEEAKTGLKNIHVSFDFNKRLDIPPIEDTFPGILTLNYGTPMPLNVRVNLTLQASTDVKKAYGNVREPMYPSIDFLPDERVVAVDDNNNQLVVFDNRLEKRKSYALSFMPKSVVVVSDDEVAITSGAGLKIDFFRVSKSSEISTLRTCKVTKRYDSICLYDSNTFLVGNSIDDSICTVSVRGEEKDIGLYFDHGDIAYASCAYIREYNIIAVAISTKDTVYLCDIRTKERIVVKNEKYIKRPHGVASSSFGCVFVCNDGMEGSIVQISHNGNIMNSYVLEMAQPYSICTTKCNNKLAVSNIETGKKKLQVFKMTYK